MSFDREGDSERRAVAKIRDLVMAKISAEGWDEAPNPLGPESYLAWRLGVLDQGVADLLNRNWNIQTAWWVASALGIKLEVNDAP